MQINEIFYSLQGEGFLVGVPSVFIRLAGCPLRCRWCDTKYAWDAAAGAQMSIEGILKQTDRYQSKFVVITGGEPMVDADLSRLAQVLKDDGKHITIETAGIAYIPELVCDLISISPKTSNSTPFDSKTAKVHEKRRLDLAVLGKLIDSFDYQIKFVVENESDVIEIKQVLEELPTVNREKVMLMPQAGTRKELLEKSLPVAEMCRQTGFAFCQRLQILLWNNAKGR